MSKLDDAIKNINKELGFNIVGKADIKKREYKRIPFVSPALTWLFKGGLPRGIVMELAGQFSSGKSTLSLSIVGQAQKLFKEEWQDEIDELTEKTNCKKPNKDDVERLAYLQDRGYQKAVYVDTEFSMDEDWAIKNGVDMDDLIFVAPENQSAEQIFEIIRQLVASDGVGLVIIDSIPAMVSQATLDKTLMDKTYCGISAPLTTFSNIIMPLCNKHICTVIGINQQRDDLSGYNLVVTPGGRAWKHACSVRCLLRKDKYYDSSFKEQTSHCEEPHGNFASVEVLKNKATGIDRRLTKFSVTYDKGIDGNYDAISLAVALGLIEKAGAWFSILDENGNLVVDEDGVQLKFQGMAKLKDYCDTHDTFMYKLKCEVENHCSNRG